jgi:hypothetical protein
MALDWASIGAQRDVEAFAFACAARGAQRTKMPVP